jgi:hypothetical protein
MSTKIFAGIMILSLLPISALLAADDPPSDPTLVGDQARAARETVKENAKAVADAAKQGIEQATNTAKDVAHEVSTATREGAQQVTNTAKNGSEKVKAAVQKNAKPAKVPATSDQPGTPPASAAPANTAPAKTPP